MFCKRILKKKKNDLSSETVFLFVTNYTQADGKSISDNNVLLKIQICPFLL